MCKLIKATFLVVGLGLPVAGMASEYGGVVEYVADGNHHMMLFTRETGSSLSIRGQFYDPFGAIEANSEFSVADVDGDQSAPRLVRDTVNGTYLALWIDRRDNNPSAADIRSRLLNPDGTTAGDVNLVADDLPFSMSLPYDVAFDAASGGFLVVWEQAVNYVPTVFGQRLAGSGAPVGGVIDISLTNYTARAPVVAGDGGRDRFLVVWAGTGESDIMGRFVGGDGTPGADPFMIYDGAFPDDPTNPVVEFGGSADSYLVAWRDKGSSTDSSYDAFAQLVGGDGTPDGGRIKVQEGVGDQVPTDVIGDGPFQVLTTQAEPVTKDDSTNSIWQMAIDTAVTESKLVWMGTAFLKAGNVTGDRNATCGNTFVLWEVDNSSGGFPVPDGHDDDVIGTQCQAMPPDIVVDPSSVDFGDVAVGTESPISLTISNGGQDVLNIFDISIGGTNADQFLLDDINACSTSALAETEQCAINIYFLPDSEGQKNATLTVTSNDPDEQTVNIPLSGTTSLQGSPEIKVEPMEITCSVVPPDKDTEEIMISNVGTAPLKLGVIYIQEQDEYDPGTFLFESGASPCWNTVVESGHVCTVHISFKMPYGYVGLPGDTFHSILVIQSNDPLNSQVAVELNGSIPKDSSGGCSSFALPYGIHGLFWGLTFLFLLGLRQFRRNRGRC